MKQPWVLLGVLCSQAPQACNNYKSLWPQEPGDTGASLGHSHKNQGTNKGYELSVQDSSEEDCKNDVCQTLSPERFQ